MGNADWSMDLLERDLAAGFALLGRAERAGAMASGESQALADGVLRCMNGALLKVSESLEAQARLRRELDKARTELREVQASQSARIERLEAELSALRQALREERERSRRAGGMGDAVAPAQTPPEDHLRRPLVLRSQNGSFLGVTDRQGQALNLSGLLRLVEGGGATGRAGRIVATCWERMGEAWCLTVSIMAPQPRSYLLVTRPLQTPSGNAVTLFDDMRVDDRPVPQNFIVQMFRNLRDGFQED